MISFFVNGSTYYLINSERNFTKEEINKLKWLLNGELINKQKIKGYFLGPRQEMITPWSTNAVEIAENMGIAGINRLEEFHKVVSNNVSFDPMLQELYNDVGQDIFTIDKKPEPVLYITDIKDYNEKEGLALSEKEIAYLKELSKKLSRELTDSEVFGFSQVNSEHCRHKIFNGQFIINNILEKTYLCKTC